MLRLNCKIFHTAVRGNIKATGDFLYLKGSTSVYSVLFLNLVGQMPLPSQASQSQHSIQVKLCPFGDRGHPPPSSLSACICRGPQEHQPRNLGGTTRLPSYRRCGSGQNAPCRGSCATHSPSDLGLRMSCGASLGRLVFPVCSPVTSHSFLLVSGGFHIGWGWGGEKKVGGGK